MSHFTSGWSNEDLIYPSTRNNKKPKEIDEMQFSRTLDIKAMKDSDHKRQDTNKVGLTIGPSICLESFQVSVQREGNQEKHRRLPELRRQR